MNVVLISTYELGHQPFGLASPAAWLRNAGAQVACVDLAVQQFDQVALARADLVAFYLPMHTATRLALAAIEQVRTIAPRAYLCAYGLYAPLNAPLLRRHGVRTILGGEFEEGLVALLGALRDGAAGQEAPETISLARQRFLTPDRSGLPPLDAYAHLQLSDGRRQTSGYTEASRGCKHLCRHCPIVPVYGGRFRVVQREVVLDDVRRQVAAGARHITFGDPDFFNGPGHALPIVRALHAEFPELTYDVTIKIEHLLKHAALLPALRDTGCLFVTSAVESADDTILERFDKRHTRADFVRAVGLLRANRLTLNPTFVTFTPWTTAAGYLDLLALLDELDLVEHVAPIQYAIRLLIPAGSRLLELPEVQALVGPYDEAALCFPWAHPDPRMDRLHKQVLRLAQGAAARRLTRREVFQQVWDAAAPLAGSRAGRTARPPRAPIPHLSEPWYC